MAWTEHDPKSGFYRVRFRYGGRKFNRSKGLKFTAHDPGSVPGLDRPSRLG